jgi:hypothetical protein
MKELGCYVMDNIRGLFQQEFSGTNAVRHTKEITQYYRAPGSSGIHNIAIYCKKQLEKYGLDEVNVETFKMDGAARYLGRKVYPSWEPIDVQLRIQSPVDEELVNYNHTPTCIAWYSTPTPPEGVSAQVVDVGSGGNVEDYQGIDVKGKIVLASGENVLNPGVRLYELAVEKFGAIGIVTDHLLGEIPGIRSRESQPDFVGLLRQPRTFDKAWTIVISGTKGARLRQLMSQGPVTLWAKVNTILTKGDQETIIGSIKGDEIPNEEVIIISHISATKPGGNCASGPAVMNEAARTLMQLIHNEKISRPKRTIKFLYVAEGLGSNAYLDKHWEKRHDMIGGVCVCGVGEDQEKCKSALVISKTPETIPSYINDFSEKVLIDVAGSKLLHSGPMRYRVDQYSPFSDNSTLNLSGIPCILLSNKPILFFHTQLMTSDKMDPEVFKVSGTITAEIAYRIANAGLTQAIEMANITAAASEKRISNIVSGFIAELSSFSEEKLENNLMMLDKKMDFYMNRDMHSIDSTLRLIKTENDETRAKYMEFLSGLKDDLKEKALREKGKISEILTFIPGEA